MDFSKSIVVGPEKPQLEIVPREHVCSAKHLVDIPCP
jgi:hypothetical protein